MRVLVTGGAGVIGFELVRALLERRHEVVALDSGAKGGFEDLEQLAARSDGRLKSVRGDFARDPRLLDGAFDAIFHLAAIVGVRYVSDHPYETMAVNMRTTLAVLDHALATGCKTVFFASSSENYAAGVDRGYVPVPTPENVVLTIDDVALPRWSYAASKIAGESALFGAARVGGFAPVVVRFHNVYGPRMGPTHVIPEFLERVRQRVDPFPVYGPEQTRSFLYAEDCGRALATVLDAVLDGRMGKGGLINIGSSLETRISDLAQTVFDVTGFHPRLDPQPAPPGSVARRVPDTSKLRALGFAPSTLLRDGIAACWREGRR
jgi:UDP-glucose 4-epimerase/UDP-glucuronate decarboxylase